MRWVVIIIHNIKPILIENKFNGKHLIVSPYTITQVDENCGKNTTIDIMCMGADNILKLSNKLKQIAKEIKNEMDKHSDGHK